jgi:hypothetical protein
VEHFGANISAYYYRKLKSSDFFHCGDIVFTVPEVITDISASTGNISFT